MSTKRPYDVKDADEFASMESDNFPRDPEKWGILHNGEEVSIHAPNGNGWVSIPVDQFNAIVDWYLRPQTLKEQS